jgi:hypothetical protein
VLKVFNIEMLECQRPELDQRRKYRVNESVCLLQKFKSDPVACSWRACNAVKEQ